MRLFVSLEIPPAVRAACAPVLARLRDSAGAIRIQSADRLHLTLAFLGEVDGPRVPAIQAVLSGVARGEQPVPLRVAGVGAFPNARRPRVLWLGVADPDGRLDTLARRVQAALVPLGFAPESRPFRPHLTVARVEGGRLPQTLRAAIADAEAFDAGTSTAATLALMQSRLGPAGAEYTAIATWALGAA